MCRILAVKSEKPFKPESYLKNFAHIAKNSKEFQGHGWGCACVVNGEWQVYKNINPVWEDNLTQFPETSLLLVHARSAFRDEGIVIENNMPFYDDKYLFILNGELHGVKIKAEGRIGAEKIFNYIKRFDKGDLLAMVKKGVEIIEKRSNYVRAMNFFMSDKKQIVLNSLYNEDPEYFGMYLKQTPDTLVICSDKFPDGDEWQSVKNRTILLR